MVLLTIYSIDLFDHGLSQVYFIYFGNIPSILPRFLLDFKKETQIVHICEQKWCLSNVPITLLSVDVGKNMINDRIQENSKVKQSL